METTHSLCIFILFLLHFSISWSLTNISTDVDALLVLKTHITHDPNTLLANNWSTSASVCSWIGVTCGVRHHRVKALNISFLGLTGTIPPQLGNLSFLALLCINHNNFYGSLPYELARLRRLKYVNFNYNQLSGNVPSSIFNISSLQELSLKRNRLSSIVNVSSAGPNLMSLDLSENVFEVEIPSFISECKQLRFLNLSYNNFKGGIPKEIGNLTKLNTLSIGYNKLQGEIPKELRNLVELEILILSNNVLLTGQIPSLLFNISSLSIIDLTNNSLTGDLPHNICSHQRPYALKRMLLSENQLTGPIPYNLWRCRELTDISLSYNRFTGRIPKDVGNLTMLKQLAIGGNNLVGEIPYEIGNLPNIEGLGLENNNLVGHIPATIFNISTLKLLTCRDNTLSGSLPSIIGFGVPNVVELNFGNNNLSGTFPSFITNASKLKILEMGNNSFSGFIPSTLGNSLTSLEWLGLSDNYFTSSTQELTFLTSLKNCKNLRGWSLAGNPLNGFLPSSIGNLSISLKVLDMEECNISGKIPQEISSLKNLMDLNIPRNRLIGSIPATLGNLQKLQGLNIRYNQLEGSIPNDLCHLNNLVDLYMDSNKLSAAIPVCFGNLTSLRHLSLGSNELTSFIPLSLWSLRDILEINLSSNSLIGTLPLEFGNLKVLTVVDLSRNHLTGDLPTTIGSLQNLQLLSLRHNNLQGSIPVSFGGMTSLEFLDLSDNNLSGVIPKSFEALSYLKYLNLSFNQLEGKIPTQGPFVNFSAKSFIKNHALCGLPHLQVPPCKTNNHPKSKITVVLAITLPLTLVVCLNLIIMMREYRKRRSSQLAKNNDVDVSQRATLRRISYHELFQATEGFSESNLLGRGSFGSVFRGKLLDGMEIAVKVFHVQMGRALRSFDVECEVMRGIRHRNLVKIISSCTNEDLKALILEYMPNGNLTKCLYSDECFLDILQRLNIMIDVALALEYLHFGYSIPIVHCDVKPSNVLLDQSMVGHLSDFGIVKLLGEGESMTQTQTLATIGYMAPEYGREGRISRKGDVYSYGIMLMETFTKKKPTDEIFTEEMSLRHWVGDSFNRSIMEVVDNDLLQMEDANFLAREQCVSSIFSLAMDCTTDLHEDRINIKNVVSRLIQIRAVFSRDTRELHVRVR
ncbi:hypothetical protein ACOSQ4_003802 [Xanthoceras sorbifolium]